MPDDLLTAVHNSARLVALRRVALLDTSPEPAFDRLARLASKLLKTPVALVSLVDEDRQFFKSCLGLPEPWNSWRQTPLSHSFCKHVVASGEPLVIGDARHHPLVHDNPAIVDLRCVAYLGIPLVTSEGQVLGSFCVIDYVPREWTHEDVDTLQTLAASVITEIELRSEIGGRKRAEALEQFRALIENALDVITIVNEEGIIRYTSPSTEWVFGYRPDEVLGQSVFDLVHVDDRAEAMSGLIHALQQPGATPRREFRFRHRDGTWRIIEAIGQRLPPEAGVEGVVINSRDITGRKQAEDVRRRTEERLRHLLASNPAFIYALRIEGDGFVPTWISENIVEILGYTPEEVLSTPDWWVNHIHPDDRARVLANSEALLTQGHLVHEYRAPHKNGSYRWIRDELRVLRDAEGRPVEIVGSWVDITQQKRVEESLRQSEKLAAMGSLLAGVAHELNNPLAVVMGRASLLRQKLAGGPLADQVEKLAQAAERCGRIVRNFLALARQRPPERGEVRLNQVVQEAVELLAYPLRVDNVEVQLDLAEDLPVLWADPHQLHQVVVNLITNAHQAMRQTSPPRRITLATRHDAQTGRVSLEVADTGPGIPPEILGRIFEPFFTTKGPGQGTGLGLSICQGIVEEHRGTLSVESQPGQGAVFRVDLPVEAPRGAVPAVPVQEGQPLVQGKRILVVDDEPAVAEVLADMLAADGHQVETAANGAIALSKLQKRAYDLVLSDLRMPELDGPGLYRELERHHPQLPSRVVFLTGDTLGPGAKEFLEAAGAPSLSKPFVIEEVRRVIQQVLRTPVDAAASGVS